MDRGITIVISPLVSLVQDQVMSLANVGVSANYLGSGQDENESKSIYSGMDMKFDHNKDIVMILFYLSLTLLILEMMKAHPTLKLLYVTPEKIVRSNYTWDMIRKLHQNGNLAR